MGRRSHEQKGITVLGEQGEELVLHALGGKLLAALPPSLFQIENAEFPVLDHRVVRLPLSSHLKTYVSGGGGGGHFGGPVGATPRMLSGGEWTLEPFCRPPFGRGFSRHRGLPIRWESLRHARAQKNALEIGRASRRG